MSITGTVFYDPAAKCWAYEIVETYDAATSAAPGTPPWPSIPSTLCGTRLTQWGAETACRKELARRIRTRDLPERMYEHEVYL